MHLHACSCPASSDAYAACRQLREQLAKSSGSDSEVVTCKSRWQKESAELSAQWELASVGMLARLSEMSQRVGRGEILQTRLAAAAEVLRAAPLRTSSLPLNYMKTY